MLEIGRKINGRYEIIGTVGNGGMANVFLAHDLILKRDVAVKVLRFDFQNDQAAIRRFQREALAATELVHPNIVNVYDVGEEDGMQYLVMEYVKGMDLKQFIKRNYPISYGKTVDIMKQIVSAVSLAHDHRIIHRDLKPQNVLIDEEGVVKITDFGIAIALSETSITQTNTMLGSVHYLSPEQARGSMATNRSDIYAMGIILFEMLTGQVPFDGESAVTIALKHFQDELPALREFSENIPQPLENAVLKATAKDPADRYQSADEMLADLQTVLDLDRRDEAVWQPSALAGETKILTPLKEDTPMPEAFKTMATPEEVTEEPSEEKPTKKKKSKKKWGIIAGLVLIITLGSWLAFSSGGDNEITVPDVSNQTPDEARIALEAAGLTVADEVKELLDENIEEGKVIKTVPEAKEQVKKNREITLYVSTGGKKVTLKSYVGDDIDDATEDLVELGFARSQIKTKKEFSDEADDGEILKQSLEKGEEVDPKTAEITFTVSKGPEEIVMENYEGQSQTTVVNKLGKLGIEDSQIAFEYVNSESVEVGIVMGQSPYAGAKIVAKDAYIVLTVSNGSAKFTLEDLAGRSSADAKSYVENNGLKYQEQKEDSDSVPEGTVIRTEPGSGNKVSPGDTITVIVSQGKKETPPSSTQPSDSSSNSSESAPAEKDENNS